MFEVNLLKEILRNFDLSRYEKVYCDLHENPELSGMEEKTAAFITNVLNNLGGFEVIPRIGGHGVVGVLRNGSGPIVLARAELDALPTLEMTGLPYASKKRMMDRYGKDRPVMHACGHDMHMAALLAAADFLRNAKEHWSGTLIVLFQPDEEETGGAEAMVNDRLYERIPIPDVLLAQHVTPMKTGSLSIRPGRILRHATRMDVTVLGAPSPGQNPQMGPNPIVIGSKIVHKLPKVEAQLLPHKVEIACWEFRGGVKGADFVHEAELVLDIKTWDLDVSADATKLLENMIMEICQDWNTPKDPIIKTSVRAPLTEVSEKVAIPIRNTFSSYFGDLLVDMENPPSTEDFAVLQVSRKMDIVYWFIGGNEVEGQGSPVNHSPYFAPEIKLTLRTGMEAMCLAILAILNDSRTE